MYDLHRIDQLQTKRLQIILNDWLAIHPLVLGGSAPRSNPLPFYMPFLTEKVSFRISSIDKWYPLSNERLTEKPSGIRDTCTSIADKVILGKEISKSVMF